MVLGKWSSNWGSEGTATASVNCDGRWVTYLGCSKTNFIENNQRYL